MTWMTAIVRNRALDWLRRPHEEDIGDSFDARAADIPAASAGPLEATIASAEGAALARCLQTLDSNQRQCVALAFANGLSHAELAAHLREPLGTVKTWIRRGLLRLKSCLEERGVTG